MGRLDMRVAVAATYLYPTENMAEKTTPENHEASSPREAFLLEPDHRAVV